ncbi:MAG: class I SAM-dependent methyltransferase [bacterium]|nr:class I SAM-dependent methyltransferase [bacterium]
MTRESVNFDRAADFYDQTRGFPPEQEAAIGQFIAAEAELNSSSRVLEIGVGTGRIALPVAPQVQRYVGIDLSTEMMGRLRTKQTTERVDLAQADATQLPFADNTFDDVIVVHVFHLVSDVQAVLRELARVVRPGGKLVHCWNRGDDGPTFEIREAWKQVVPNAPRSRMDWSNMDEVIQGAGWRLIGDTRAYHYPVTVVPQNILRNFEARAWSATWELSEEDHARGVEAVREALLERFPEPSNPVNIETAFNLNLYHPPQAHS